MADQEEQNKEEQSKQDGDQTPSPEAEAADDLSQEDPPEENGVAAASEEGADVVAEQAAVREDVLEAEEESRNIRKERVGTVVSDKMEKTVVVRIERSQKHPMYKKYLTRSARKMTHDENDEAGEGDTVRIMETRPISKRKRWRLVEILERAA
ncbi:MAG: 30S ribosomal protein S17 [Bacteroidetes bacterium QS_8_68_28]|jgi:small subunit ribosomal protein S17|nr:MAG: 30S ribosomal protein S17 [Bacteroidetes bacterium QS_8_68_28]